jgi:hypothetical protein
VRHRGTPGDLGCAGPELVNPRRWAGGDVIPTILPLDCISVALDADLIVQIASHAVWVSAPAEVGESVVCMLPPQPARHRQSSISQQSPGRTLTRLRRGQTAVSRFSVD